MTTSTHPTADEIRAELVDFVSGRTSSPVTPGLDLFGSGLVSSLFAMQLVVHVEQAFGLAVPGPELTLANFRTVDAITDLVLRLRGTTGG